MTGQPLTDKRVLVTRSKSDGVTLTQRLKALGAEAIHLPLIETVPPDSWDEVDDLIRSETQCDWLIFTSRKGVESWYERLKILGMTTDRFGQSSIAAVGSATADALAGVGISVDLIPEEATGAGIAGAVIESGAGPGTVVIMPRAMNGRPELPYALKNSGVTVYDLAVYQTRTLSYPREEITKLFAQSFHAVILASPSAVDGFVNLLSQLEIERSGSQQKIALVSIGPTTSQAIVKAGWKVSAEALAPSVEGLVDAAIATAGG